MIAYTGDIHGNVAPTCGYLDATTSKPETLVILGDVGLNYFLDGRDRKAKKKLNDAAERNDVDIFCIHGNHEARPATIPTYHETQFHGAPVLVENEYSRLKFAIDGEIYDLDGKQTIVIGGAYSVDKYLRLEANYPWFADEQPSAETKRRVEKALADRNWQIDQVLSHTTPHKYEPTDTFLPGIDQTTVDTSTEDWLDEIEDRLTYDRWYAGHFHINRRVTDKFTILFDKIVTDELN